MEKISDNAIIKEIYKKNALVEFENKKRVVKLKSTKVEGDTAVVFSKNINTNLIQIVMFLLPLVMFLIGFGIGFVFRASLYHYLIASCMGVGTLLAVIFVKLFYINKIDNKTILYAE